MSDSQIKGSFEQSMDEFWRVHTTEAELQECFASGLRDVWNFQRVGQVNPIVHKGILLSNGQVLRLYFALHDAPKGEE